MFKIRKIYFIGLGLLLICVIIGSFTLLNNSSGGEGKVIVNGKQLEEGNLGQMANELAHFIADSLKEKDINGRLGYIQNDIENFPKLLIYIETVTDSQEDRENVERKVNDIVQLAKEKSVLQENVAFEIIVKEQGKKG